MDQATRFREAAERHNEGRGRTGWRYPPEIRALAVEYCERALEAGASMASITAELGITPMSLSRWLDEERPRSAVFPVQVVEPPTDEQRQSSLAAVTPGGLRIEGLDWAGILDLVYLLAVPRLRTEIRAPQPMRARSIFVGEIVWQENGARLLEGSCGGGPEVGRGVDIAELCRLQERVEYSSDLGTPLGL